MDYKTELERAYRALRGIYGTIAHGDKPTASNLAYHSLTLAAAMRFVADGELDGTDYFVGKDVSVLQGYLKRYGGQPIKPFEISGSEP